MARTMSDIEKDIGGIFADAAKQMTAMMVDEGDALFPIGWSLHYGTFGASDVVLERDEGAFGDVFVGRLYSGGHYEGDRISKERRGLMRAFWSFCMTTGLETAMLTAKGLKAHGKPKLMDVRDG